jgi:hypothetical protein
MVVGVAVGVGVGIAVDAFLRLASRRRDGGPDGDRDAAAGEQAPAASERVAIGEGEGKR